MREECVVKFGERIYTYIHTILFMLVKNVNGRGLWNCLIRIFIKKVQTNINYKRNYRK